MKVGLSGGYFNFPLPEQLAYFQSMPEYLLYDGLKASGIEVNVYGTADYSVILERVDVFNCHHLTRTMQLTAFLKRSPLVVTLHNPFIASGFKPELNRRILYALHRADRLVALSQTEKNHLICDYGFDRNRIAVIPNGLKQELYTKPEKPTIKQRYKIPEDRKIILTVVQLLPFKNISMLLKVFKQIQKTHKKTVLIIKTSTPVTYTIENVIVITDKLKQKELVDLYNTCDLYVQPSNAEALCTCITEAMLCGKPVVASDVGGTNTQVINDKTGLLVPAKSKHALYKALTDLLTDETKSARFGKNGRVHASRFNQDAMVQAYLQLYRSVIK